MSQVSKTAPSGEYLTAGSFMIRGKKNFLLPSQLVLGFGFLFKLEDGSVERHKNERKVRGAVEDDDDAVSVATTDAAADSVADSLAEVEIDVAEEEDEDEKKPGERADLSAIAEEDVGVGSTKEEEEEDAPKSQSEEEEEEGGSAFPDTNIDIKYSEGGGVKVLARGLSESSEPKTSAASVSEQQQQDEEVSN